MKRKKNSHLSFWGIKPLDIWGASWGALEGRVRGPSPLPFTLAVVFLNLHASYPFLLPLFLVCNRGLCWPPSPFPPWDNAAFLWTASDSIHNGILPTHPVDVGITHRPMLGSFSTPFSLSPLVLSHLFSLNRVPSSFLSLSTFVFYSPWTISDTILPPSKLSHFLVACSHGGWYHIKYPSHPFLNHLEQ